MAVHVTRAGVALTVGIILVTGLIIGGLFWVKNSGEQARRDEAIKIAEQNLEKESDKDVALNSGDEKSEDKSGEKDNGQTNTPAEQQTGSDNQANEQPNGTENQVDELPQTGPAEDSLFAFAIVGLIVFMGVAYWRSRRMSFDA